MELKVFINATSKLINNSYRNKEYQAAYGYSVYLDNSLVSMVIKPTRSVETYREQYIWLATNDAFIAINNFIKYITDIIYISIYANNSKVISHLSGTMETRRSWRLRYYPISADRVKHTIFNNIVNIFKPMNFSYTMNMFDPDLLEKHKMLKKELIKVLTNGLSVNINSYEER